MASLSELQSTYDVGIGYRKENREALETVAHGILAALNELLRARPGAKLEYKHRADDRYGVMFEYAFSLQDASHENQFPLGYAVDCQYSIEFNESTEPAFKVSVPIRIAADVGGVLVDTYRPNGHSLQLKNQHDLVVKYQLIANEIYRSFEHKLSWN